MRFTDRTSIVLTLCAITVLTTTLLIAAQYEYSREVQHASKAAQNMANSDTLLKLAVYKNNRPFIRQFLASVLELPETASSGMYDRSGKLIAHKGTAKTIEESPPFPLQTLRGESAVTETSLRYLSASGEEIDPNLFARLFGSATLHLTAPITTSLKLTPQEYSDAEFLLRNYTPENESSRWVVGYLHVELDRKQLVNNTLPAVLYLLTFFMIIALLAGWGLFLNNRKIMVPVRELQRVSDDLARGLPASELNISDNSELASTARTFNAIIKDAQRAREEAELDRKLLSRKVEESTSRLSQQDDQLNQAAREISEAKDKLQRLVNYDGLTSLPNRTLFQEILQTLLRSGERAGKPLALLYLNLNEFRRINESFGYSTGDLVLREMSKRMVGCLRRNDVVSHDVDTDLRAGVARMGGDEFAIILDQIDRPASAGDVAQRLIECMVAPIHVDNKEIVLSPSIGIAVAPETNAQMEMLIRQAGIAMKAVPASRQGAYLFYSDDLEQGSQDQFQLEGELRSAIENEELALYFQPQVDSIDGSVISAEVLLRWDHPQQGKIPPTTFIPMARQLGLMQQISGWTIREACRNLQEFRASGIEMARVAINISADELGKTLADDVRSALAATDLSAESLELGLSEIVLMDEESEEARTLRTLSSMGVHLSLDNFGISATPLSHLGHCPLNALRIDRDIVHHCDSNKRNAMLVKTIIAIADSLGLRIVAEGVETEAEFSFLVGAGARALQGYLFSEPVPADRLKEQLKIPWPYMGIIQNIKLAERAARQADADRR